ncbi:uncharacterized protein LOC127845518 isoform X2 [Dreissena polymorpha]|uniref:Uncharacterized protein n=2 Tax=Dreissena polymorpha TaxID=45954 RepID=A0A9D4ICN0_DREPO|nr:uncharacterized protein LOC127845518 isoform X2 [Dreissena polymorpha]XP_052232472.1 uncharacterized protein LOC127845518 isoform X2 [Dreissena polymorpha]KAH3768935.1 hypothetical protein DPMN_170153 [Dreissena polymorpha]
METRRFFYGALSASFLFTVLTMLQTNISMRMRTLQSPQDGNNRVVTLEKSREVTIHQRQQEAAINLNIHLNVSLENIPESLVSFLKSRNQEDKLRNASILNMHTVDSTPKNNHKIVETDSFLTLFATWKAENDTKEKIHNFTFVNWARMKPAVNPILFTDSPVVAATAHEYGWNVLPLPTTNVYGLPILKLMFLEAIKQYNSHFYGYANSDILFTNNLILTLVSILYQSPHTNYTLVTGLRTNVYNLNETEAATSVSLTMTAATRGQVFQPSAEDYFITTRDYPWDSLPDLVVGTIAYDNYLVLNARYQHHNVIDASKTILAIHQSNGLDVFESHIKLNADYNKVLLRKRWFNINPPYIKGFLSCIEKYVDVVQDIIVIKTRTPPNDCKF